MGIFLLPLGYEREKIVLENMVFSPLVQIFTIYYPKEYLKGVEIVDTPGFNDPIVSREERTKDFLKRADVVLMMLYAGRPFDATDRDIIFKNVRQCGIGKVLVGINKYDIPYCSETNPEDENQIKAYVVEQIRRACRECNDDTLNEILSDAEPIPLSAEMALLSELPMSKISASPTFDFAWKRHCSNFGIGSQSEMRKFSHIDDLANAIKSMVSKEKDKILFTKPLNAIFAAGDKRKTEIEKELGIAKDRIETLLLPDSELDEKEESISKANKRMSKKIDSLGEDIETELQQIVRKGKNELEDIVDASCKKIVSILENDWKSTKSFDSVRPNIEAELDSLVGRKLKRATQDLADQGKRKIDSCVSDFFADAEDVLMRFAPDFDSRSFVKSVKSQVNLEIQESDLFHLDDAEETEESGVLAFIDGFVKGATFGVFHTLGNMLSHREEVSERVSQINRICADFDPSPYLETAFQSKDEIISVVKEKFITELIEPLQNSIREIREMKDAKASELEKLKERRAVLEAEVSSLLEQMKSMNQMKALFEN